jgi:uncharacterized protein
MLNIVFPDELPAVPWKNGGGLTREIARLEAEGALIWRISIADVVTDGPFSLFPGLTRILTVIAGDGIDLHSADDVKKARLEEPIRFSGELPIIGRLTDGPIRDLNVIYDATRLTADVQLKRGPLRIAVDGWQTGFLVLGGPVRADGSPVGRLAFVHGTQGEVELGGGAFGLLITFCPCS